ncbi:hypothetical protein DL93DRAFT_1977555 [Clavulina sp. PMI_390]|nr:hypothetical protein DL93DRAFT_1977555 [Clavulina sp. PMI_390]
MLGNMPKASIDPPRNEWDGLRVVITSVSKRWREIAFANANLWSILDIQLNGSSLDTTPAFIEVCINHSKAKPLDIFVHIQEPARVPATWEAVVPGLVRCRSLYVWATLHTLNLIVPFPNNFPLLENATFVADSIDRIHAHPQAPAGATINAAGLFLTPLYAPRLRRVRVKDFDDRTFTSIPLESLDEFTFESHLPLRLSTLPRLSQVRHLVLNCAVRLDAPLPPSEFPNMETLEFDNNLILPLISAPQVSHIITKGMAFLTMLQPETFPRALTVSLKGQISLPGVGLRNIPPHQMMPSVETSVSQDVIISGHTQRLFPSLRLLCYEKFQEYGQNMQLSNNPAFHVSHNYRSFRGNRA